MAIAHAILPVVLLLSAFAPAQRGPEPAPLYAEARRDCAPWDGSAFSVDIQPVAGVKQIKLPTLRVSIWQGPDLPRGGRFTFPDLTGKVGAAYLQGVSADSVAQLRGTVSFASVVSGKTVEGQFDLVDASGKRYAGKFSATWIQLRVLCG